MKGTLLLKGGYSREGDIFCLFTVAASEKLHYVWVVVTTGCRYYRGSLLPGDCYSQGGREVITTGVSLLPRVLLLISYSRLTSLLVLYNFLHSFW